MNQPINPCGLGYKIMKYRVKVVIVAVNVAFWSSSKLRGYLPIGPEITAPRKNIGAPKKHTGWTLARHWRGAVFVGCWFRQEPHQNKFGKKEFGAVPPAGTQSEKRDRHPTPIWRSPRP